MIIGIHHIAISVENLDTAVSFYQNAFGFAVVQTSDFNKNKLVDAAIAFVELWEYTHPQPKDLRSRPCDYGYPHFALQVSNIDDEYDRLIKAGMTFAGEVVHFTKETAAIYGKDPFGNIIELYEINTPDLPGLAKE